MVTSVNGTTKVTTCTPYNEYVKMEGLDFDNTVRVIENYFNCSGICYTSVYRSFTDISKYFFKNLIIRGPGTVSCMRALIDYVEEQADLMYLGCFLIGGLIFLGFIGSVIIACCMPSKRKVKSITLYKYDLLPPNII